METIENAWNYETIENRSDYDFKNIEQQLEGKTHEHNTKSSAKHRLFSYKLTYFQNMFSCFLGRAPVHICSMGKKGRSTNEK